ncbi:MAG: hypothetical protein WC223_00115 [Bacteroidales bacterium]|jgi:hypothetical protein
MKTKIKFLLLALGLSFFIFCKKDNNVLVDSDINTPLTFTSLVAKDSVFTIANASTDSITAELTVTATGDGLNYTWSCTDGWGTFAGSGNKVTWTYINDSKVEGALCHPRIFKITCIITDKNNNSLSKDVSVYVQYVAKKINYSSIINTN